MVPSWHALPNGSRVEIMSSRPRMDLFINMPALRKLDNMLLEILDGFSECEYWYVDEGILGSEGGIQREEEKRWMGMPCVPPGGLSEGTRKQLNEKLECGSQILKAASAINVATLAEMEVPDSYMESLPKNGKGCLGDVLYRYISSCEHLSPDYLVENVEDEGCLEMANRIEAAIHVWRRQRVSSWEMVRDVMMDGEMKRGLLVERAENLLLSLRLRFPTLMQTALDATKIQCNKDVGKSILESYSRVLESLAFNIMSRIEDLLYVDDINKTPDKNISLVSPRKVIRGPFLVSSPPARAIGDQMLILSSSSNTNANRGLRVITNYVKVDDDGFILEERKSSQPNMDVKESSSANKQQLDRFYLYSSLR
ncbi:Rop guanine nucleotide exchange factor 7 [Striga hermonthica]|uniref:Rop guanine nucleotide exchange factor 7 n=1 Tax=Striga hermonthica TaxID=68872 RepID=A0A9N7MHH7_STRHE|nr:Rop guanine nucleotide exchange factor 7 [Striga hermonthica]